MNILILTPLRLEEIAIHFHLPLLRESFKAGTLYYESPFKGKFQDFNIVTRQTGSKNNVVALETDRAIQKFQPNLVFLVGIAGGVKDAIIGDVVVAMKNYGYEAGKATDTGFVARPEAIRSSPELLELAKSIANKNQWQQRISNSNKKPKVYFGAIASGDKVVTTTEGSLFQNLKSHYNDTLALEMEAIGFAEALSSYPNIKMLNVRGISDLLADKNSATDENNQPMAAAHAAAFLFEMIYQLDVSNFNINTMDIKTIATFLVTAFAPYLKKSKSVETISKEISEATDTTLGNIWEKIKPIFIEEFVEEEELTEAVEEPKVLEYELGKKLKKDKALKQDLEALLEKAEKQGASVSIVNSKNVISGSNISVGGDFHLGDERS